MVPIVHPEVEYRMGGTMPNVEHFQDSAQHCFELARLNDFLEDEAALEAFDLMTANDCDRILAHALGVSL